LFTNRGAIRDSFFGDWLGQKSCSFFDSECTYERSQEDNWSRQEHHCQRDFSTSSRSQANTVGQYASEEVIKKYIQNQGKSKYTELHKNQLRLF
jgi:hypothetical protein